MTNIIKKSGQKIAKRASRFSRKASETGKEHVRENLINRISHIRDVRLLVLEWSLLVLVVILLASVQSFWYSDSYSVSSFKTGGTYIEGALGKVNSLNPLFASTNSEKTLSKLLFSTLMENDFSGHVGAGLARYIRSNDAGDSWAIMLRDNLKWSDGEPLTNEDILFTVDLIQNPKVSSNYSQILSGVEVSESATGEIVFKLSASYADFDTVLNFPILPKHVLADTDPALLLESDFSKKPVSSGAFSFNATQTIGSEGESVVYLIANENYYKGKPFLVNFAIHAFLDKEAIITAINSGTITATAELSSKDGEKITSKSVNELQTTVNSGAFAFLNTKSQLLSNVEVRRAIQKGIDVQKIRENAKSSIPLNHPILHSQVDSLNWQKLPDLDVDSAKEAINKAGINSESEPLSIVTINEGNLPEVAESLSEQLRELGFNVNMIAYDYSQEFISNVINTRSYDIFVYEVELGPVPELFSYYHSSQTGSSGLNFSNYNNTITDDIILASRETTDQTLRNAKFESFIKNWISDVPAIALYQPTTSYFYNKSVRTFSEDLDLVVQTDRFDDVIYWATEKTSLNRTP
ncbi:hypothetical protein IKG45_00310 [Candidatus Saccharibacteria bacterium]|nr:hypothetical protein [Candidatus Saccharibacteria bacterium]